MCPKTGTKYKTGDTVLKNDTPEDSHVRINKKGCLVVLGMIIMCVLCVIFTLYFFLWWRTWNPFSDDGHFHGKPRESVPARHPDQVYSLYDRFTLEVYDATADDPAPTVLLKDKNSKIKWSIYALADDMDASVKSIRFHRWKHFPFREPRVFGIVDWTFGHEGAWWFISKEGELKEYWYSW